jgi:hypothetical protein
MGVTSLKPSLEVYVDVYDRLKDSTSAGKRCLIVAALVELFVGNDEFRDWVRSAVEQSERRTPSKRRDFVNIHQQLLTEYKDKIAVLYPKKPIAAVTAGLVEAYLIDQRVRDAAASQIAKDILEGN